MNTRLHHHVFIGTSAFIITLSRSVFSFFVHHPQHYPLSFFFFSSSIATCQVNFNYCLITHSIFLSLFFFLHLQNIKRHIKLFIVFLSSSVISKNQHFFFLSPLLLYSIFFFFFFFILYYILVHVCTTLWSFLPISLSSSVLGKTAHFSRLNFFSAFTSPSVRACFMNKSNHISKLVFWFIHFFSIIVLIFRGVHARSFFLA